jgi:hypothetical protein
MDSTLSCAKRRSVSNTMPNWYLSFNQKITSPGANKLEIRSRDSFHQVVVSYKANDERALKNRSTANLQIAIPLISDMAHTSNF